MDGYTFAGIFLLALWTVLFVGAFLCSAREQSTRVLERNKAVKNSID